MVSCYGSRVLRSDPPRQFAAAFSIGNQCGVAHQLQIRGLRQIKGPLDWVDTTDEHGLEKMLAARFAGLFDPSQLEVTGVYRHPTGAEEDHLIVRHRCYGMLSKHDFPCSRNGVDALDDLDEVKRKFDQRINDFMAAMNSEGPVLFVRRGSGDRRHYKTLFEILGQLRNGRPFELFAVVSRGDSQKLAGLDSVSVFYEQVPGEENHWTLDDKEWDRVLGSVAVAP